MTDQPIAETGHPLQGPHGELTPPGRGGFTPLVLRVQPLQTQVVVNQAQAIIGRHSHADIRLAFPEISRRHARVAFENGQWHIFDLNSLNNMWVNGEQRLQAVLYEGDRIRIGCCLITVERGSAVRLVTPPRQSDPEVEVLQSIADVLPRQAS